MRSSVVAKRLPGNTAKKQNGKIHLWSVVFLDAGLMINDFGFLSHDFPHFRAIASRAATSRACALLTKNLNEQTLTFFKGFCISVNGCQKIR